MLYRTLPLLLFLLLGGIPLAALAQDAAQERALLTRAQQTTAAGQWDEVVAAIAILRQHYPQSTLLPEGLVLLYQAHVHLQATDKAAAVGKEIVARWPKSSHVWQVVLITCKQKAKLSPMEAVASLDLALQQDMLSAADRAKAVKQRFLYLEQAKSERYYTDALESIKALKPPITPDELQLATGLAKDLYPYLMRAKRFDEAKAVSETIQEHLAKAGNPQGGVQADTKAYLDALKKADPQRFAEAVMPVIRMAKWAETAAEVNLSLELAAPLYLDLLRSKPYAEVKALRDDLQATLVRLQLTERIKYEQNAWLSSLQSVNPAMAVAEMRVIIGRMQEAKTAEAVAYRIECTELVYKAAFEQHKPEEAAALHAQVQDFLTRFHLDDDAATDRAQYACARLLHRRAMAKAQYLTEVMPTLVGIADGARTSAQIRPVLSTAVYYGPYRDLFAAGYSAEATKLYERIQAALTRIDAKGIASLTLNRSSYLNHYSQFDPEGFLAVYLPLVIKVEQATGEDVQFLVQVSPSAYSVLIGAGRLDEARRVHAQLQAAIARQPNTALAGVEMKAYFTTLADVSPADFVKEMQPVLTGLAKAQTAEEALRLAPMVQMAYAPLNQSGSILEARTAHEQLQALFAKHQRTAEAEADRKKFKESISVQALEAMLQLFKKAAIANDLPTAKKWLDELNAIAPESPQAARARGIWKEVGAQ